jgi:hypothetical protein
MKLKDENKFLQVVQRKEKEGKLIVNTIEGLAELDLKQAISQPTEGLLWDLNRDPVTIGQFINDPKWINDYACMVVIKALKAEIDRLTSELGTANSNYHTALDEISFLNECSMTYQKLKVELESKEIIINGKQEEINRLANTALEQLETISKIEREKYHLASELAQAKEFHPRAMKLISKKKNFVVVAEDEPYYIQVYAMIRQNEHENWKWSIEDEELFQDAKIKYFTPKPLAPEVQ